MYNHNRVKKPIDLLKQDHDLRIIPLDNNKTIGGTFAFLINRSFCKKILEFIHHNGIKHGIDYVINAFHATSGIKQFELVEDIAASDWVQPGKFVDSDIQIDRNSIVYFSADTE